MADSTNVLPGSYDTPTIAPLYIDGMPVGSLVDALDSNSALLSAQRQTSEAQFWSTPRRNADDTTQDVMEVGLASARKVNLVSFELARFPHQAFLFYENGGAWQPVLTPGGRPIQVRVLDSVPSVITPAAPGDSSHAQHYGAGHWKPYTFEIAPIDASRVRLVLVRTDSGTGPRDSAGRPLAYSLGVRGFNIGYRVRERSDIPRTRRHPSNVTEMEPFTGTSDLLGSPVTLAVRENRASDLLSHGATWRSEPQPLPTAVVNLYVDARLANGEGQVIDRFFVDPITTGVHVNLYYSNQPPDSIDFDAVDTPLTFPALRPGGGEIDSHEDGLVFSATDPSYLDINTAYVQFNPDRPFWLGMVIRPQFDNTDTTAHVFLDGGLLRVEWTGTEIRAMLGGIELLRQDVPFNVNEQIPMVLAYDGAQFLFYVDGATSAIALDSPPSVSGKVFGLSLNGLRVGADLDGTAVGNFALASLILKTGHAEDEGVWGSYVSDPTGFVVKPEFDAQDTGTTRNAIVRYDPSFQSAGPLSLTPFGFVGGTGNRYEDVVWTPVNRDFKLHRGYLQFDPVKARFFKFEFTNLAPQPHDEYEPITRTVKVFPQAVYEHQSNAPRTTGSSGNTASGASTASRAATATMHFSDEARLYTKRANDALVASVNSSFLPTEGLYSSNAGVRSTLRSRSYYYSLAPWHPRKTYPRFREIQIHSYDTIEVEHTERVAYFVGLSALTMCRIDYGTSDDTAQYLESFDDALNLAVDDQGQVVSDWAVEDGRLATPDGMQSGDLAVATSRVFGSARKVTAIQFATQQTPPVQLVDDADFDDPSLTQWASYGDAVLAPSAEFNTDIGTLVKVTRSGTANFWESLENRYDSWDAIEDSDPDPNKPVWDDIESSPDDVTFGGIASSVVYEVSPKGRVYAAARVYSTEALKAPLTIQVLSETGQVLAQEPADVAAGQVTEWYASYTVGEGGEVVLYTWDDMEALGTWDDIEALGTWDQVDSTTTTQPNRIQIRLVQEEPTDDTWYVDNFSIFNDPIVWSFSNDFGKNWHDVYDIRNDPNGVFVFPPGTADQDGLGLMWKVTGARPGQKVDNLAIRPWYDSQPMGQPYRETIQVAGPNQAPIDQYLPIGQDPRWQAWHKPIPEDWWFKFRQWLLSQRVAPTRKPGAVLPGSIVPHQEPQPPIPWHVENQALLYTAISGSTTYVEEEFYPFGPTASTILDDGTIFVASHMFSNYDTSLPGFIRLWHLASDLTVLGSTDLPYDQVTKAQGNPAPFALAADGNKVVLLVESGYDDDAAYPTSVNDALFDSGSAYTTTTTADRTWTGTGPSYLQSFDFNPPHYGAFSATDTTDVAIGGHATLTDTLPSLSFTTVKSVTVSARVYVPTGNLPTVGWRLVDTRLPYGSDTLASGTGMTVSTSNVGTGWKDLNVTYLVSGNTEGDSLADAFTNGAVGIFISLGVSGSQRRLGAVSAYPTIGRRAGV